jgi:hypothetical protein
VNADRAPQLKAIVRRFLLPMRRLLAIAALVAITAGVADAANTNTAGDAWITVNACQISLLLPRDLKRTRREGIDSCIAEFENRKMLLSIDYGWYGGPEKKSDVTIGFKEESFAVGGKTGSLATYVDNSLYARNHPERKYVSHLYVVVQQGSGYPAMTTSLMMTVRGRSARELEIANRIFRSVVFS